jgi:folate-binding protein YgfZ
VPRQGSDVDDKTIPQEAGLELDAVSFTKGCFLGQELVCRIDTRGHVNRQLRRVAFASVGAKAGDVVRAGDKEVGTITSIAVTDDGAVALAMLRHEVEPESDVVVQSAAGDLTAHVTAL